MFCTSSAQAALRPNPSLRPRPNGVASGARCTLVNSVPRGPGATPSVAAQLERRLARKPSPMPLAIRFAFVLLTLSCQAFAGSQGASPKEPPLQGTSALLVVDAQVGVLSAVWESQRVIANLEKLVRKARDSGALVVWVQHSDDELKYGSDSWKLAPNFVPMPNEPIIHKKYNSSFANTDLDEQLRKRHVSRIVLAGAATNWCVRATAYAAVDRGYSLTLVSDAHSTESIRLEDGRVVPAESIVIDLNVVFQWLSVPSVRTEVKTTADVEL